MKKTLIFNTDPGLDDAAAFLVWAKFMAFEPDYILTTAGNASRENMARNALILKKYLGLHGQVVRGAAVGMEQVDSNGFHGADGLAGLQQEMIGKLEMTQEELRELLSFDAFREELLTYDEITVVSVSPLTDLSLLLSDEVLRPKIRKLYIMGGGLHEFNREYDTEFNFFRYPDAAAFVLGSDAEIMLFPLDLTNHQRLSAEEIEKLAAVGTYPEFAEFFRFNRQSNIRFNRIDGAVLHDIMPVLYLREPEKFTVEEHNLMVDAYGHVSEDPEGNRIRVAMKAEAGLVYAALKAIFTKAKEEESA